MVQNVEKRGDLYQDEAVQRINVITDEFRFLVGFCVEEC